MKKIKKTKKAISLLALAIVFMIALPLQGCASDEQANEVIEYAYVEVVGNGNSNLKYREPDKDIYIPLSRWTDRYESQDLIWVFDSNKRYLCFRYPLYNEQLDDSYYEEMLINIGKQDLDRIHDKKHRWNSKEKEWFISNNYKVNYDEFSLLSQKKFFLEESMQSKRKNLNTSKSKELGKYVDMLHFGSSSTAKDQEYEASESKREKQAVKKAYEDEMFQKERYNLLKEKLQMKKERLELEQLKKELDSKNVNSKKDLN